MLSFWEKSSFINYDVAVIGSGIVGLSTAISLKEKNPRLDVVVLERGILPTGASTKNAGFACVGSLAEICDDLETMSPDEVLGLVSMRKKGLEILLQRCGASNIGYYQNGSHEMLFENELHLLERIDEVNQLLFPLFQKNVFGEASSKVSTFGFNANLVKTLIENNAEGELHSGKMMRTLIQKAQSLGVVIYTGAEVDRIDEANDHCEITLSNATIVFSVKKVAVCTNAFSKKFLHAIDLKPGRGQVLITKPVKGLKPKGIFHFDKGYYYFRKVDDMILFGGGRNIDFTTEEATSFEVNRFIVKDLKQKLRDVILPDTPFEVDYTWTGIMAFGPNKYPVISKLSDHVFAAVRMGGMGVAIGSAAGEKIAVEIIDSLK